jgi:hypothetical protein
MHSYKTRLFASIGFSVALVTTIVLLAGVQARAQVICPVTEFTSGLQRPLGITQSGKGNLLVAETGTGAHDGRVSIVDPNGNLRPLLSGLPSGIPDVPDPSGPAGLVLRGRTLYVAIGIGDAVKAGPVPGTAVPNPPSSPIFSSVLAIHFSENFVERSTAGFTLSLADQQALASGESVTKSNGGRDRITVELIANFPDVVPEPSLAVPNNVRGSNPFDLVLVEGDRRHDGDSRHDGDRRDDDDDKDRCRSELLYVTDGGRNLVWKVDINSGAFSILAVFPQVANPFYLTIPPIGPPFIDAVPTGIAESQGQLLVTLFRGAPFPPGTSAVAQVNPLGGNPTPFITGLKTAIDVLPITRHGDTDYLVLQHASVGPFFGSPGLLLRFETPAGPPTVIADCLTRPTSMTLDKKTGTLYVSELAGRIVAIPVIP